MAIDKQHGQQTGIGGSTKLLYSTPSTAVLARKGQHLQIRKPCQPYTYQSPRIAKFRMVSLQSGADTPCVLRYEAVGRSFDRRRPSAMIIVLNQKGWGVVCPNLQVHQESQHALVDENLHAAEASRAGL
jgi:hypothetical protein